MMRTEAEAMKCWCPFSRHYTAQGLDGYPFDPPANRWADHLNPDPCRCLASDCMAWRWATNEQMDKEDEERAGIDAIDVYGYCGLAGKP